MSIRIFSLMGELEGEVLQKVFEKTVKMFPKQTVGLANSLADNAREIWEEDAKAISQKQGWGEKYAESIKVDPMTSEGGTAKVYAEDNMFVNIVEHGITSWSIKDALLSGKAAQMNSMKYGHTFVRVPFRWRTPITSGSLRTGTKQSSFFTGQMSAEAHRIVRGGGKLIGAKFGHMTGMVRVQKSVHSQYNTFRTVSQKSTGWQYPAVSPAPVYETMLADVKKEIGARLRAYVKALLPEIKRQGEKI